MRICILTTETLHHAYFARAIAAAGHEVVALVESRAIDIAYDTAHPFEDERDTFEREFWFDGHAATIAEFVETMRFPDINAPEAVRAIKNLDSDLMVTFGTGLLKADVIVAGGDRLLNLHGGDPEHYRGLDTHLWAIWHGDFAALSTCLHRVAAGLDTGDILSCLPLDIRPGHRLHMLRRINTDTCIDLVDLAMDQLIARGRLVTRPQGRVGRYYSAMPAVLKGKCVERFSRYADSLR